MNKAIAFLLILASLAFSTIHVAVVEVEVDPSAPGLAEELNKADLRYITLEIRRQARNNLPGN
jgi:hypothetical protein